MDSPEGPLVVLGVFIAGVFFVAFWRGGMIQYVLWGWRWNRAIAGAAEKLKIGHRRNKGTWDTATGSIGGVDIALEVGDRNGTWSGIAIVLEVGAHFDRTLTITRSGEPARVHVPSQPHGWNYPTPAGISEFDSQISLCGAGPSIVQSLHVHAELRSLLLDVVGAMGAQVRTGKVVFKRRSTWTNEAELIELMGPVLDVAKWLSEPAAPHPQLSQKLSAGSHAIAATVSRDIRGPERQQAMWRLVHAIGQQAGQGEVTFDSKERSTDWRGLVHGCPTRIRVEISSTVMVNLTLRNHAARFVLEYDPTAIPQVGTPPAWDDDEQVKVFVARGVYFAQHDEAEMASFRELPKEAQDALCSAIQRDSLRWVSVEPTQLAIRYRHHVNDMVDPVKDISRGALLLGWLAQHLAALPPSVALSSPPGQSLNLRVTCRYCSTAFLHGCLIYCPNCGATYQSTT